LFLKLKLQPGVDAAGDADGGAGEQAGKIDDVDFVGQIRAVDLKANGVFFAIAQEDSERCIEGALRARAVVSEIDAIQDGLAVFESGLLIRAVEIDGKAAVIEQREHDRGRRVLFALGNQDRDAAPRQHRPHL